MLSIALNSITTAELEEPEMESMEEEDLTGNHDDPWDAGLLIAAELVRQLTLRRQNTASSST